MEDLKCGHECVCPQYAYAEEQLARHAQGNPCQKNDCRNDTRREIENGVVAWAIADPEGKIILDTIKDTKGEAERVMRVNGFPETYWTNVLERGGCRFVRVRVVEEVV